MEHHSLCAPNPFRTYTTITADAFERMTAEADAKPIVERRTETLKQLGGAPLISGHVLSSSARAIEGLVIMLAGAFLTFFHPGYELWDMMPFYAPLIVAAGIAYPFVANAFGLYSTQSLLRPVEPIARLASIWTADFRCHGGRRLHAQVGRILLAPLAVELVSARRFVCCWPRASSLPN